MKYPVSMTAFGRGEFSGESGEWTVEIRSVNHRFCDIRIKQPRQYAALEEKIKKLVSASYSRAHIEVLVTPPANLADSKTMSVDIQLARQYRNCLLELRKELHIPESGHELELLANYPNIITTSEEKIDLTEVWQNLEQAVLQALDVAQDMREREGQSLKDDLLSRLYFLSSTTAQIEEKIPELVRLKHKKLQERLEKISEAVTVDPDRLAQEIALIADKSDVTEELVRLTSHIDQFHHFLEKQEPVGRRLDFLLQEFLREINTMASKISDAGIAHLSVDLKNEVEKMREQVQNLE